MNKLSFSIFQLICDSKTDSIRFIPASKDMFEKIPEEFDYTSNKVFYKIFTELSDDYFWLVAEFGNPEPCRKNVVNIETHETGINKRRKTEVELTSQSFLLYDFRTEKLYISNSKHQNLFGRLLSSKLDRSFIIKRIFVNFEEFISIIKSVNKIKFTSICNLFSADSVQFNALKNLTGTDAPESFSLEATYKEKGKIEGFLNFLNKSRQEKKIDGLVICGEDERGLEKVYNADSFTSKISINCKKNGEGVYDYNLVRDEIIKNKV